MSSPPTREAFLADVATHRAARERRLRSPDGWLALAGRWVLEDGDNAIDVGTATLFDGQVTLSLLQHVEGTVDGQAVTVHTWPRDATGPGPYLFVGTRRYELLRQGARVAIRVRDPENPAIRAFTGLRCYAPDERFRVNARLEKADPPRTITLPTGLGGEVEEVCPGTLVFSIDDLEQRLDPVIEGDPPERLFILFTDPTNRDRTYGAGRFLYAPLPDADGQVVLDFNKCFNPPCALTVFAACPIAPAQNRLRARIEAGEQAP
jgi:uncharacterized protein (DUF1684 family)